MPLSLRIVPLQMTLQLFGAICAASFSTSFFNFHTSVNAVIPKMKPNIPNTNAIISILISLPVWDLPGATTLLPFTGRSRADDHC